MYKKSLIAAGLILGFSTHSVFAEGGSAGTIELTKRLDRFEQARRSTTALKSNTTDIIINTRNVYETSKSVHLIAGKFPISNKKGNPRKRKNKNLKADSTERKKTATEKLNAAKKKGHRNPNKPNENEKTSLTETKNTGKSNVRSVSKSGKRLYRMIYNGRPLKDLSPEQRRQVYEMHKRYAKTREGQIILRTIQRGEGGGLLVIVGKGKGKSDQFKQFMNNLTTRTHPANQFPKKMRCFFHSKYGCSTAAGFYQITKTNYDYFVKYLGITDFTKESQDIMALELIRTGNAVKVPGSYQGRGYIEMMKNNRNKALIYGTDDWASSSSSRWKPHNRDYTQIAPTVAKEVDREKKNELKGKKYFQSWIDESEKDGNS